MGEAAMDGLSDRGSIPLSSTLCIHFQHDINVTGVGNNSFRISPDDALLLFRTFCFVYLSLLMILLVFFLFDKIDLLCKF